MVLAWAHRVWVILLLMLAGIAPVEAGLRDIHPRPQQMGLLGPEAIRFFGTPYLIIPDNPSEQEALVRDEAIRLFEQRTGRILPVVTWSNYTDQIPTIWMGTFSRFPQLTEALQIAGVPGLGSAHRSEEYQIFVEENRVLLGASDELGLRWGLQSLTALCSDLMGQIGIDRVYIRDWPDFGKRVGTANALMRNTEQYAWSVQLIDLAYQNRMNEIEWNNDDLGRSDASNYNLTQAVNYATIIRNRGQKLTISVDRTPSEVAQLYWQEAVPILGTMMRVTTSGFVPVENGYGIAIPNNGFESWNGNRPTGWIMSRDSLFSYVSRDAINKHSGSYSVKLAGFTAGSSPSTNLMQVINLGSNKYVKVKFWYKLSDYCGQITVCEMDTDQPYNKYSAERLSFTTPTTRNWTLYETKLCTFNATEANLMIGPYYATRGTVWLDDVTIETCELENMVRREDTPLQIRKYRTNEQLAEGIDYQVFENYSTAYPQYVRNPLIMRLPGGRLNTTGDTVLVNWSVAPRYQGTRWTQCFSQSEILLVYQERIRHVDSLLHPDEFKIQINEVCYSNYDDACTRRNLTPAQLIGSHCRQMYQIIQARRPGAKVRIYGDVFDIYSGDVRANPSLTLPWTAGALQELPAPMEIMCMEGYSSNLDSSLEFFAANQHPSIMSLGLWVGASRFVAAIDAAARHSNCTGTQWFVWQGDCDDELPELIQLMGDLSWNNGPYIIHDPVILHNRPDSLRINAEIWSDSFRIAAMPSITSASLRYRQLPNGNWTTAAMTRTSTDRFSALIPSISSNASAIEYYITAIDHRAHTSLAPADAPQKTFMVGLPFGSGSSGGTGGDRLDFSLSTFSDWSVLEWNPLPEYLWYEIHRSTPPDFSEISATRVARQDSLCPRLILSPEDFHRLNPDSLYVIGIREPKNSSKISSMQRLR